MRIDTSGNTAYRTELYELAGRATGESTKVGGIDASCRFTLDMLGDPGVGGDRGALEVLVELLEDERLPDDVAAELASAFDDVDAIEVDYQPARSSLAAPSED